VLNYIDLNPNIDTFASAFTKTNTVIGQTITGANLNNNVLTLNRFDGTNIIVTGFNSTNITSVTYNDIITTLGYTPYDSTNPDNYISSVTFNNVVNALGYTPLSSSTNNNYIESSFTESNYYKLSNPNSFINFISGDTRYELITNKGIANGYVPLNASVKIDNIYLPTSVLGSVNYKGLWNASTNTPTLTSSTGTQGFYYIVSVSGNTNIDGITDWKVNDWIIFNGITWDKLDNTENFISFNGRNGVITLLSSDVISALGYTPYNSTNPNQYISSSFTESRYYLKTNPSNYISSVTSSNITTALGYVPLSSSTQYSGLTVTGDVTGSTLTKNITLSLQNIIAPAIVGSSTQIPIISFDAKGRITSAYTITVAGGSGSSGITSINNQTNNFQTLVTGNTGNDFNINSSGGIHTFNIPTASSSTTRGLITSNDFNTFTNKANITYVDNQITNLSSTTLNLLQNYTVKDLFYPNINIFNSLPYYQSIETVITNPNGSKIITPIVRIWSDTLGLTYLKMVNQNGTTLSTSQIFATSDTITTLTTFILSGCTSLEYQILTDTTTNIKQITLI
jgi:hypothetical protein